LLQSGAQIKSLKDPCINPKAQKNTAEQAAIRAAHITDGVAMVKFLHWLDQQNETSGQDELSVAAKLESFRQQGALYRGQSFSTISGFAGNGAIVHYHPTATSNAKIDRAGLLLVDSGAQYANGTTDITRTVAIGSPTSEMRESFTRVLKGHIAVAAARFPKGTVGKQIDSLARAPLRAKNMDYAHGTGHGVGCYLSVHEEAAGISSRVNDALEPGMLLSNEPGYYKKDEYGIRIENLVLVQEDGICADTGSLMYCFETVSFAPIDRKLIEPDLLDRDEKSWLNAYHQRVYDTLKDKLPKDEQDWLKDQIQPI
jgi:Xaa-Pro aminopeptidase